MHLPKFTYLTPTSMEEAVAFKKEDPHAGLMAGGTDILPRMKNRLDAPEVLIGLQGIRAELPVVRPDGALSLHPLMTLDAVCRAPSIRERAPVLSEAALTAASAEIRNMGTLGGNLCQQTRCLYYNQRHTFQFMEPCYKRDGGCCYFIPKGKKCWAVFMSDTAPALISLSAEIGVMGSEKARKIPLESLYTGDGKKPLALDSDEMIGEILIPEAPVSRGEAFYKFSLRGGVEFGAMNVAAVLDLEEDAKTCAQARITVGALACGPRRALKGEATLAGKELSNALFLEVGDVIVKEITPIPHHGYSAAYLTECVRVGILRVLESAAGKIRNRPH